MAATCNITSKVVAKMAIVFVLLAPLPLSPAETGTFSEYGFELPGRVHEMMIEDLDEDGFLDVILTTIKGKYPDLERGITVLLQRNGGFHKRDRQDIVVLDKIAVVDVGQVDGNKGKDIIALCSDGISYYPFSGQRYGSLTRHADARPFAAFSDPDSLILYDFLKDWNKDGNEELLLIEIDRSLMFSGGPSGLSRQGQELTLHPFVNLSLGGPEQLFNENLAIRASYYLPQVVSVDHDGDGRNDLVGSWNTDITIHKQKADGTFTREPEWTYGLRLPEPDDAKDKKERVQDNPPTVIIDDVNNDSRLDVVVSRLLGRLGNLKSQTFIYYGHTGSLDRDLPDQVIELDNAGSFAMLRDLDSDGRMDLVVPHVKLDILSVAKMIITSTVDVQFSMYMLDAGGKYPGKPTAEGKTTIQVSFREMKVESGVPNVEGDFNGDGTMKETLTVTAPTTRLWARTTRRYRCSWAGARAYMMRYHGRPCPYPPLFSRTRATWTWTASTI